MMRSGFPDIQWTIEDMVTEIEKVAVRFIMRGTHKGAFFWRTCDWKNNNRSGYKFLPFGWQSNY
jgi:hypothetical protein